MSEFTLVVFSAPPQVWSFHKRSNTPLLVEPGSPEWMLPALVVLQYVEFALEALPLISFFWLFVARNPTLKVWDPFTLEKSSFKISNCSLLTHGPMSEKPPTAAPPPWKFPVPASALQNSGSPNPAGPPNLLLGLKYEGDAALIAAVNWVGVSPFCPV